MQRKNVEAPKTYLFLKAEEEEEPTQGTAEKQGPEEPRAQQEQSSAAPATPFPDGPSENVRTAGETRRGRHAARALVLALRPSALLPRLSLYSRAAVLSSFSVLNHKIN